MVRNRKIAIAGVITALIFVFCFIAGMTPVAGASFLIIASFFTGVIVVETNAAYGFAAWAIAGGAMLLFAGNKLVAVPAVSFFLLYPIIKKFIERDQFIMGVSRSPVQWFIKIIFFIMAALISYMVLKNVFEIDYPARVADMLGRYGIGFSYTMIMIMLAIVLTAAFVIYDIAFSELGRLYITKYSSKIRGNQNDET